MSQASGPALGLQQHYIGGEFCASESGATFEAINPATETLTALAASGEAADIDKAVKAAKAAFDVMASGQGRNHRSEGRCFLGRLT